MRPKFLPNSPHFYYSEEEIFGNQATYMVYTTGNPNCKDMKMHSHEFLEINVVMNGNGYHYIGETSVPAREGDVFVIPPNTLHGYFSESSLAIEYIVFKNVFFEKHYPQLSAVSGFYDLFELEPHLRQVYNESLFLHLSGSRFERCKNSIARIGYLNTQNRTVQAGFTAIDMICDLCHYMSSSSEGSQNENSDVAGILKALQHIHDNYSEKLTIENLALVSKMSQSTFNRHFRKILKQSPMQYLIDYRVKAAQKMLDDGIGTKTEIAQKCGFYDVSHMDKYLRLTNTL